MTTYYYILTSPSGSFPLLNRYGRVIGFEDPKKAEEWIKGEGLDPRRIVVVPQPYNNTSGG